MADPGNSTFTLSSYEQEIVNDSHFLLTKQRIIEKVVTMFGQLAQQVEAEHNQSTASCKDIGTAKISKGENYLGLPYVVLDYPRLFGKDDTYAIRCFFWWGNFFSITLQLSGIHLQQHIHNIRDKIAAGYFKDDWHICVAETPWHHHFQEDNYVPVGSVLPSSLSEKTFIKLAKKIPLSEWDSCTDFYKENFKKLINLRNY